MQDIEFLADPTAGEVRIAAPIGWGAGLVATAIDRLARRYPRVVCHLTVCDSPPVRRRLLTECCGPDDEVLKIMPPLTIEPEILEEALDRLRLAVDQALETTTAPYRLAAQ